MYVLNGFQLFKYWLKIILIKVSIIFLSHWSILRSCDSAGEGDRVGEVGRGGGSAGGGVEPGEQDGEGDKDGFGICDILHLSANVNLCWAEHVLEILFFRSITALFWAQIFKENQVKVLLLRNKVRLHVHYCFLKLVITTRYQKFPFVITWKAA